MQSDLSIHLLGCPHRPTPTNGAPAIHAHRLDLAERLDRLAGSGKHAEDVESDGLGEGSALANDDLVTGLDTESGRDVGGKVLVAPLVTRVFGDEVEVLAADDQGACTER